MLIRNRATNSNPSPNTGVVRTLRCWLAAIRIEAIWNCWCFTDFAWLHEGVFLLDAIPSIMLLILVMDLHARCSSVADCRLVIPCIVSISKHHHVRVSAEWIIKNCTWADIDLRVSSFGLLRAAAIVIPDRKIGNLCGPSCQHLGLGAWGLMGIKPDVFGQHTAFVRCHFPEDAGTPILTCAHPPVGCLLLLFCRLRLLGFACTSSFHQNLGTQTVSSKPLVAVCLIAYKADLDGRLRPVLSL
mmetsp:Transcript_55820/g.120133  ORF Transcript_55820/g.120133 Transcript_55820/m.120133 type:complete len:243 (-) Transcript_55820:176-904(-)